MDIRFSFVCNCNVKVFLSKKVRIATELIDQFNEFFLNIRPETIWIDPNYTITNDVFSNTSWNVK